MTELELNELRIKIRALMVILQDYRELHVEETGKDYRPFV